MWKLDVDDTTKEKFSTEDLAQFASDPSVRNVDLSSVRPASAGPVERLIYKVLGLQRGTHDPIAELQLAFSGAHALVIYVADDDDGVIATEPESQTQMTEPVRFVTAAGESFVEPRVNCIPRASAIRLLEEFHATGQRPSGVTWVRPGVRHRER